LKIKQLKQPFEIYYTYVEKHFPKTPPDQMIEVLGECDENPVSNQEFRELLGINRTSAFKFIKKLCKAGLVQHTDSQGDGDSVELTGHGKKVLADLEQAMRSAPEVRQPTTSTAEESSNSAAEIRLDELEAGVGALISKLQGRPVRRSDAAKLELPPKRPPMSVPGRRRHGNDEDQLPLDYVAAMANGS